MKTPLPNPTGRQAKERNIKSLEKSEALIEKTCAKTLQDKMSW